MTNWELFVETMQWRYRLGLKHQLGISDRIIRQGLSQCQNPYLALSGGKDSLVTLDLAMKYRSNIDVVQFTALNLELPGTDDAIFAIERHYGISVKRIFCRDWHDEFYRHFGVWPHFEETQFVDGIYERKIEAIREYGWDAYLVGMRSDESVRRRISLKQPVKWKWRYTHDEKELRIAPIAPWTIEDVWAYIIGNQLPYHSAYPLMVNLGIPIERARVDSLTNVRIYQYGFIETIKRLWPEKWNELTAGNPCIAREA